ncbi:MAG: glutamine--fructose-6-phosphate transaminase (isomerizing), partial [Actinomycetota bacterium]
MKRKRKKRREISPADWPLWSSGKWGFNMCGIVGYVGSKAAAPILLASLRGLEYRGYDSAGIAVVDGGKIDIVRRKGNLKELAAVIKKEHPEGGLGIGHTRWATHGAPSERNAHPHVDCTSRIAVVHNGIIENYLELKEDLIAEGHVFASDTDTEVLAHLIEAAYDGDLTEAVRKALARVEGSYALAVVATDYPDMIVAARKDSPMVVGLGKGENYLASDIPAILGYTKNVLVVEDNEIVIIGASGVTLTDLSGGSVTRKPIKVTWDTKAAEKSGYEDFMLKEIFEQPSAVRETMRGRVLDGKIILDEIRLSEDDLRAVDKVFVVACGTSYHAGMVAKYAIESWTRIPVEIDIASEFRYRNPILDERTLMVA